MVRANEQLCRSAVTLTLCCIGSTVAVGPAMGAPLQSGDPGVYFATSELAQVMLSVGAVSFAVLAARIYGGEIGKAIFTVSGGVILFSTWQLLNVGSSLLQWQSPPASLTSTINLVVTVLLLAGFYMLYETVNSATTA